MSSGCFQMISFALWPCMNCEGLFFVVTLMNLRVRRRIFPLRKIRFFKCPKEYYINYQECKSEILHEGSESSGLASSSLFNLGQIMAHQLPFILHGIQFTVGTRCSKQWQKVSKIIISFVPRISNPLRNSTEICLISVFGV